LTGGIDVVLVSPKCEGAGLDGAGALEAPAVVGDALSEIAIEVADGCEGFVDDFAMLFVGQLLFRGEDAKLAGESVAIGIEAATALAFGSFGSRGMVGARSWVGLLVCHSVAFPFANKNGQMLSADHYRGIWEWGGCKTGKHRRRIAASD